VADVGERWCALLESVLVSPRISTRRAPTPRTAAASDSGSGMGAEVFRQMRSDAVYEANPRSLTCANACEQALRTPPRPVRDEGGQPDPTSETDRNMTVVPFLARSARLPRAGGNTRTRGAPSAGASPSPPGMGTGRMPQCPGCRGPCFRTQLRRRGIGLTSRGRQDRSLSWSRAEEHGSPSGSAVLMLISLPTFITARYVRMP
jgi:hypothetical protein